MRLIAPRLLLVAWILSALHAGDLQADATSSDVMTIVKEMKEIFEPARPSVRKIKISVSGGIRPDVHWEARKATRTLPEVKQSLLVLLEPRDLRGHALLVEEREDRTGVQWVYLPFVQRVRKIVPVTAYEYFLNSDFTYADLGFVSYAGAYELLGEEERAGEQTYKVAFTPENPWYYSHVITWVSKETHMPIERDYYDMRGGLWKRETFDLVTIVNGIPTPFRIQMNDLQAKRRSVFAISEVRFDVKIPKELFRPEMLSKAADSPLWEELESAE